MSKHHTNRPQSWILYGPQGSGKTRNARAIADHFGLTCIIDEWNGQKTTFSQADTLHITNHLPKWIKNHCQLIDIDEAVRLLEGA